MGKIKELYVKYKDVIPYLIFGVLTTLVNVVSFWICAHPFAMTTIVSTVVAWVLAVLFAYVTNRKWVFHSSATGTSAVIKEMVSFFACRLATGLVDIVAMWLFVDVLNFNDVVIKFLSNVVVIVLNYVASKLIIFAKKK